MLKNIILLLLPVSIAFADNNVTTIDYATKCNIDRNASSCFSASHDTDTYEQSKSFIRKGCDIIGADTCLSAGYLYYTGDKKSGYKQDKVFGLKLLDVSCDIGKVQGCILASEAYKKGNGVKKDLLITNEFYISACNLGEANACNLVSYAYYDGKIVRQNYSTAKEYAGKSCDLGNTNGCKIYKELNKIFPFDPLPQF
ncbi:MAG: tetratricopeptide repeat protein [Sulfurovaceae bacterium]|nr:tetratricopeptide repeat protein [Sulfurovaceae bacterium]